MARNAIATLDVNKGTIKVTMANGKTVEMDTAKVSDEVKEQAMMHGFVQKIRDSFAGAKGNVDYAQAQVEATVETLMGGAWNRRGGFGGATGGILAEAVARIKGYDVSEARAKIQALSEADQARLRKAPEVAAEIAAIQAERKRKAADAADETGIDDLI